MSRGKPWYGPTRPNSSNFHQCAHMQTCALVARRCWAVPASPVTEASATPRPDVGAQLLTVEVVSACSRRAPAAVLRRRCTRRCRCCTCCRGRYYLRHFAAAAPQSSCSFECPSVAPQTLFRSLLSLWAAHAGGRDDAIAAGELVGLLTVLQACGVRPMAAAVCAGVIRQGWTHLPMLAISSKGAGGCCHWSRCPCGIVDCERAWDMVEPVCDSLVACPSSEWI